MRRQHRLHHTSSKKSFCVLTSSSSPLPPRAESAAFSASRGDVHRAQVGRQPLTTIIPQSAPPPSPPPLPLPPSSFPLHPPPYRRFSHFTRECSPPPSRRRAAWGRAPGRVEVPRAPSASTPHLRRRSAPDVRCAHSVNRMYICEQIRCPRRCEWESLERLMQICDIFVAETHL